MDKQIKEIKKIGRRLRRNGDICLFPARANAEQLMNFCNILADKIDEIIDVVNKQKKA